MCQFGEVVVKAQDDAGVGATLGTGVPLGPFVVGAEVVAIGTAVTKSFVLNIPNSSLS
jgi:hypothetical protein